jgi:biopolymer transport protein TolR
VSNVAEVMHMAFTTGPAEINVTPLIDVLLVLLIIFMIIVPIEPRGLDAMIPREPNGKSAPPPERTIVIQLEANEVGDPAVRVNHESVAWEELHGRLLEIFKLRAEKIAFVKADGTIEFEHVARAIDIARGAGVYNVGLMR